MGYGPYRPSGRRTYDGAVDAIRTVWDDLDPGSVPRFEILSGGTGAIVVLLGAFDPPTHAHLDIARASSRAVGRPTVFCLTKVLLDRPPDALLRPMDRLGLLEAVGAQHGIGLAVCNRGTYLEVHEAALAAGCDPVFVIGSDKLAQLADPSFYADGDEGVARTLDEVGFLVVERGGVAVPERYVRLSDVFEVGDHAQISASDVRRRVLEGEPVDDLVPPVVARALRGYTEPTERG